MVRSRPSSPVAEALERPLLAARILVRDALILVGEDRHGDDARPGSGARRRRPRRSTASVACAFSPPCDLRSARRAFPGVRSRFVTDEPGETGTTPEPETDTRPGTPVKRWVIGEPLPSDKLEGQLLPKHLALPIFASDPLSSVAYAPQELLMILLIGGLGLLASGPWVALGVVVLLLVVVLSLPPADQGLPVRRRRLRGRAARTSARRPGSSWRAALLVDYVMTVAVSVASGVDNIISAIPVLNPFRV